MISVDIISYGIWGLLFLWFFGGLAAFLWLKWEIWVRRAKKAKEITVSICREMPLFLALMGPFYIPIIVSAICLYFSHN